MRRTTTFAVTIAVMAGLVGCTTETTGTPVPGRTTSEEPTTEPVVVEPTPEPTVEAPQFPTEAGASIPLDQVEAARAAGIPVYVSPNGGNGVVVQPGQPLPAQVVNDFTGAYGGALPESGTDWNAKLDAFVTTAGAYEKTGVPAVFVFNAGVYGTEGLIATKYTATVANLPEARSFNESVTPSATKAEALAKVQPFIDANPGIQVVDLT